MIYMYKYAGWYKTVSYIKIHNFIISSNIDQFSNFLHSYSAVSLVKERFKRIATLPCETISFKHYIFHKVVGQSV